jgi:hypothetical protein
LPKPAGAEISVSLRFRAGVQRSIQARPAHKFCPHGRNKKPGSEKVFHLITRGVQNRKTDQRKADLY